MAKPRLAGATGFDPRTSTTDRAMQSDSPAKGGFARSGTRHQSTEPREGT